MSSLFVVCKLLGLIRPKPKPCTYCEAHLDRWFQNLYGCLLFIKQEIGRALLFLVFYSEGNDQNIVLVLADFGIPETFLCCFKQLKVMSQTQFDN